MDFIFSFFLLNNSLLEIINFFKTFFSFTDVLYTVL